MALKQFNPTSPGRRGLVLIDKSELHKGRPEKSLVEGLTKKGGRGAGGRIAVRFRGGAGLDVPLRIVWGERDRIARRRSSQLLDQLPPDVAVERWAGCGHMLMWDAPERVTDAILALEAG